MHRGLLVGSGAILAVAACATDPAPDAAPVTRAGAAELAIDRRFAAQLEARPGGWTADGAWLTSVGWRSTGSRRFWDLGVRLGAAADAPFEIGMGHFARKRLRVTRAGARSAPVSLEGGRAIFRDAYPSTDVIDVASPGSFEEFFLLRDARAPESFDWHITLPTGIRRLRAETSRELVFVDRRERPILHVPRAFAVDAAGVRREATLKVEDDTLRVHLDREGLTFPILLDPAVDTATGVWEQVTPATSPPPRSGAALTYDPDEQRVLLFGGISGPSQPKLNDTWSWDGSSWTMLTPAASPPPRSDASMAYDTDRHVAVLYGGEPAAGPTVSDTWEFDGTTWAPRGNAPALPTGPGPRSQYGLAFFPNQHATILFGGLDASGSALGDGWGWDGSTWTALPPLNFFYVQAWGVRLAYSNAPPSVVAFGGFGPQNDIFSGDKALLVAWDGTTWSLPSPIVTPAPRDNHGLAFDTIRQRLIMFGGVLEPNIYLGDTWEWDGTAWAARSFDVGPGPRTDIQMAFDAARARTVLFGGYPTSDPATWLYHAVGDTCAADADCDDLPCVDGVCCDRACDGACESCVLPFLEGACSPFSGTREERPACAVASCKNGVETRAAACADGACPAIETHKCSPFACGKDTCLEECTSDDECADGSRCDPVSHGCSNATVCDGDHTLQGEGGATDCSPYRCAKSGTCLTQCESSVDCVGGSACDAERKCTKIEAVSAGGCGCRTAGGSASDALFGGGAMLALGALLRLRRRGAQRSV